ncbi:phosphatidate cytidylyltransferase [Streptacidiphilus sp. PB12-B1b]|uniref:phosphatidate cytidylyltransferase n=1 Tax=Streptacidiphilus sp. PB12-B1b TaxID=2705012 RepID=UPI001CDC9E50|nr:phosphatidate cytidylyltransferase [Streptacidiphilus sp. PB12-B1b]
MAQTQYMPPVADSLGPDRSYRAAPPGEPRSQQQGPPQQSPEPEQGDGRPGPGQQSGQPQPEEATRLTGPLFRDDVPPPPPPVSGAEQTAILPPISDDSPAPPGFHPAPPGGPAVPAAPSAPRPPGSAPAAARTPQPPKAPKGGRDLRAAVGVGVGLGVVVVASLVFVKWLFVGVVAAVVVIGMWELTSRLKESKGIDVPLVPLVVGGVAMLVSAYLGGPEASVIALALTSLAVLVWRMAQPPEDYLRDVTAGIFTAFYVPFLATFVMLLLAAHDGPQRVVVFMVLTVCSDTGAYAAGSRFGKHKLAPRISPGKTREGLAGGVLLCMLAGALGMQFMITGGSWWQGLVLGACVAVSATLGDLGESMIKRDLGIKDMGTMLPGHGGIMDRLDSLLPTAPVVWLVLVGFVGAH